jgi:transposase
MSFIRKIKKKSGTYLAEVENTWQDGKVKQKHIRYVGKLEDDKTVLASSISDIKVDSVKMTGALPILNKLAESIDLPELLGDFSNEILSLVYAHCLNYKSLNNMPKWFERTDLNQILNLKGLTESKLLAALDSLEQIDLIEFQKKVFRKAQESYDFSTKGVFYDVTNTYVYGSKNTLTGSGYSKDGKRRNPLIQIALAVTREDGIPLMHKSFEGKMRDPQTYTSLGEHLKEFNISNQIIVYDRGVVSRKNLELTRKNGWHCITGLSLVGKLKKEASKLANSPSFLSYKNRVELQASTYYVKSKTYEHNGVKGKLLICLNNQLRLKIKESRHDEISHAEKQLKNKGKRIKEGLKKYFDKENKVILSEIEKAELLDGFSCLFCTNQTLAKDEIIRLYYEKDLVEKAFRTLKGVTNLRPIRHWLYKRVIAHIFICYLSYMLLSLLKFKLKDIHMPPIKAIEELKNLFQIYCRDTKNNLTITKSVAPNKTQVEILKQIDPELVKNFP